MIESTILTALTADTTLKTLLSEYTIPGTNPAQKIPAIFDGVAPEGRPAKYLTYRVTWRNIDLMTVEFTIFFDYFETGSSKANARKVSERIEAIFDGKEFEHERYSNIQFYLPSGDYVPEDNPQTIHYNLMITARAGRKKFVEQLQ